MSSPLIDRSDDEIACRNGDDPIFNGLAIPLLFGILVSTLLTLVVIPLLYYLVARRSACLA